jgi:hypothetical protein
VPWLEHLDLRHHPVGEERRGGEVRNLLERIHDDERLIDLGAALATLSNMGTQRGDAEADVAVHEKIDFVGKQMAIYHIISSTASYARASTVVSAESR